ncbi:MAG: BON domain-containing protein [Sulfuricaulis sp.]
MQRTLILFAIFGGMLFASGCAPLIIAGGATTAVAASERNTLGSFVDDESIELKSTKALNDDPKLGDNIHIDTTSMDGIVLLTGEAETAELRDEVIAQIRPIPGIRRIVNEIRVAEPSAFASQTNDSWITGKVKAKLIDTKNLASNQIKVVTEDSVVYLMGRVNKQEGDLVTEATRDVGGITRVVKLFEYTD